MICLAVNIILAIKYYHDCSKLRATRIDIGVVSYFDDHAQLHPDQSNLYPSRWFLQVGATGSPSCLADRNPEVLPN